MIIHHELIHLKRKDLWIKALTLGVSILHWFNPLAHILRKEIHTWSELSCDEEVVKEMSYADRKRYGETILNVMTESRSFPIQFSSSLSGDGKQLKRRLTIMLNAKKLKKKTLYLTIAAALLIAVISTTAAAWASNNTPKVENRNIHPESQSAVVDKNEPLRPVNDHFRKPHLNRIPPGTSITIRPSTPEERAIVKELEEEYKAALTPEELGQYIAEYESDDESSYSIPRGTSITIRALTPEERAAMKVLNVLEEELRKTLTPEELAEYDFDK